MSRPQLERDDPLDLSILLSGGEKKLTRIPSVAASEDGEAQRRIRAPFVVFEGPVAYGEPKSCRRGDPFSSSCLDRGHFESLVARVGDSPVGRAPNRPDGRFPRVGLFEIAALRRVVNSIQG